MGMPAKLKNLNLFADGASFMGVVSEVTLPKLALKMEEWRGGGHLGPLMVDMGLEKLELDFTLGGLSPVAARQFGATQYDAALLRFAGAYQDDGTGQYHAVEVTCQGRYQEMDWGNAKAGGETAHKYKAQLVSFRLDVDGANWFDIDLAAGIYVVFGQDRYAEVRAILGT